MKDYLVIDPKDNVAVAIKALKKGQMIAYGNETIELLEDVSEGHKIALCNIKKGSDVIKYGDAIGHAILDIAPGEWVHTHNMSTNLKGILTYSYDKKTESRLYKKENLTFRGYKREDGTTGIRNELWIVPTVGCANGIADRIIERFKSRVNPEGIDSIQVFKHNYGCSQLGDDHENTKKILRGIVNHPNAGGVLVLGLGCENNQVSAFMEGINRSRVRFLVAQDVKDEVTEGERLLEELYLLMKEDKREEIPISELRIGLKCGGSDGFSGITANPLVGAFSDYLVSQGGTTVLTETPEMFGAEKLLMSRAQNEAIFNKIVDMINDFKEYFIKLNQPIYENPSPGNKAGGITTLEEKSLGCIQKGGKSEVMGVLKYGDVLKEKGLNLLNAPGNDLVASTALAASGCQIVLFTTGRGTPFGTFVPTVKISTNTQLYKLKPHWIDFNAGVLLEDKCMDEVLNEFIKYVISVANGELTNNEKNDFREIAIFKTGVTL